MKRIELLDVAKVLEDELNNFDLCIGHSVNLVIKEILGKLSGCKYDPSINVYRTTPRKDYDNTYKVQILNKQWGDALISISLNLKSTGINYQVDKISVISSNEEIDSIDKLLEKIHNESQQNENEIDRDVDVFLNFIKRYGLSEEDFANIYGEFENMHPYSRWCLEHRLEELSKKNR